MLNFLLCDDNIDTLNKLSHILESIFMKHDFEAQITFKTTNPNELLLYIQKHPIDVLVLDINLNSTLNGLDIAKYIRSTNNDCYIIFITAHSEFVFIAYNYKTFDFICKPFTCERIEQTIIRLFEDIKKNSITKKFIKLDNRNTLIDQNEIQYIKRNGMKVIFHTANDNYETYSSFNKLKSELPENFIRCHKSFIVNINNITKLEPKSNLIYFKNNTTCDIGPKYKKEFLKEVNYYA